MLAKHRVDVSIYCATHSDQSLRAYSYARQYEVTHYAVTSRYQTFESYGYRLVTAYYVTSYKSFVN